MRAAQKARWAAIKGTAPSEEAAPKKKRKMSAEGLANIRAGVAKRWAAQGKAVQKPKQKRKMTPAWRAALERAWEARRAKSK
jgi:mono/diheme cytochrome c family protein